MWSAMQVNRFIIVVWSENEYSKMPFTSIIINVVNIHKIDFKIYL